jgi:hypothetical protein
MIPGANIPDSERANLQHFSAGEPSAPGAILEPKTTADDERSLKIRELSPPPPTA